MTGVNKDPTQGPGPGSRRMSRIGGGGWAPTELVCQAPALLCGHHAVVLQVTLVAHQDDLGVVPRVRLDLRRPGVGGDGVRSRDPVSPPPSLSAPTPFPQLGENLGDQAPAPTPEALTSPARR